MLIRDMVNRYKRRTKDDMAQRELKSEFKDEADKLESLKRQLAQAKRTGGDKEYEKELEEEIKELEAQYQREGLTKDESFFPNQKVFWEYGGTVRSATIIRVDPERKTAYEVKWNNGIFSVPASDLYSSRPDINKLYGDFDPRGYKVKDQIIKGFMIYKSGKPNIFTAKDGDKIRYEIRKEGSYYCIYPVNGSNKIGKGFLKEEDAEKKIKELNLAEAKDFDPRGYKVKDQIIKGFMIYKSGKPNQFTAKNENGEQYEGTMEQIKKQIDAYWVKRDEDVMKQKVNDAIKIVSYKGYEIIKNDNDDKFRVFLSGFEVFVPQKSLEAAKALIDKKNSKAKDSKTKDKKVNDEDSVIVSPETGGYDISVFIKNKKVKTAWKSNKTLALQTAIDLANFYRDDNGQSLNIVTKDSRPKHPRWRIKDDKMFKLKTAAKKMKDSKSKDEREPDQSDIEASQRGNRMNTMSLYDLGELVKLMEGKSTFAAKATLIGAKQMIAAKRRAGARDATNYNGEREFRTYEAWRRACKQINPNVVFEGDKDTCQAKPGIGEWGGDKGILYNTKDAYKNEIGEISKEQWEAENNLYKQYTGKQISYQDYINGLRKLRGEKGSPSTYGKVSAIRNVMEYQNRVASKSNKDAEALPIGKHDDVPDSEFDKDELAKGIKVEMEHTNDPEVAKSIARDHLFEIRDYYTRLLKMEAEAKGE